MEEKFKAGSRLSMEEGSRVLRQLGFKPKGEMRKYHNVPTDVGGIRFDSKAEAAHYRVLLVQRETGVIRTFFRQVLFDLPAKVRFKADFVVIGHDGSITIEEVKGFKTAEYKIKKKLVEDTHCRPFGIGYREIR